MGVIRFDIRHPNGQREAIVVEGERALIGSASHCDVRLPMDQADYEHVLLEVLGGTLRVESKAENSPPTVNGMPVTASTLAPDAVLGVGRVRLFVDFVPDLDSAALVAANKKQKKGANPLVQVGLVAMFGLGAYLLLADPDTPIEPPPAQAPELFTGPGRECPQADPDRALAFAQEQMDLGDAKRERLPFAVREGVAAVSSYELAGACFRKGANETRATDADDAARSLKHDLVDNFRARRIRLSHLLAVQDYELAYKDVTVLRALTDGQKGPYVDWLAGVARRLAGERKK